MGPRGGGGGGGVGKVGLNTGKKLDEMSQNETGMSRSVPYPPVPLRFIAVSLRYITVNSGSLSIHSTVHSVPVVISRFTQIMY